MTICCFVSIRASISITIINKCPEKGSPCLHPCLILKGIEIFLFMTVTSRNPSPYELWKGIGGGKWVCGQIMG